MPFLHFLSFPNLTVPPSHMCSPYSTSPPSPPSYLPSYIPVPPPLEHTCQAVHPNLCLHTLPVFLYILPVNLFPPPSRQATHPYLSLSNIPPSLTCGARSSCCSSLVANSRTAAEGSRSWSSVRNVARIPSPITSHSCSMCGTYRMLGDVRFASRNIYDTKVNNFNRVTDCVEFRVWTYMY